MGTKAGGMQEAGVEMALGRDEAETIALTALGWLAGNADLSPAFLAASGLAPDELASRAADPDLLTAVLDFLMTEDEWVRAFCDTARLPYDRLLLARVALPGGEVMHWT